MVPRVSQAPPFLLGPPLPNERAAGRSTIPVVIVARLATVVPRVSLAPPLLLAPPLTIERASGRSTPIHLTMHLLPLVAAEVVAAAVYPAGAVEPAGPLLQYLV